ncbi:protein RGF1 INDUCIBLE TRANSCRIPTION FACTOR 1-like isoform X1 [Diospyros lotus]|uniref:protein RGF1 INDUCIBLE TRANSCRIPTION FACTOR 1-like isoform X1 n=1 Tax=Diospyros lotus TaxID=55363 RepID=UPI00225541A1|nr:protein RGF1 INDUCIBLE TRANSCRIPTION FACTOR 1-like isoform X1 [Diospyros lotus]
MAEMLVPPWLEPLLNTAFFSVCRIHGDAARSECNMYCLDCNKDAFCFYCRSTRHNDHQVIQIRRSSYHDVVRVSEIENVLDISGVQTYVINSARVLFLNERPQPKSGKSVSHICEICGRTLLDPFRFCSLGCKESRQMEMQGSAWRATMSGNWRRGQEVKGCRQGDYHHHHHHPHPHQEEEKRHCLKVHSNKTRSLRQRRRLLHHLLSRVQEEERESRTGHLLKPNHASKAKAPCKTWP